MHDLETAWRRRLAAGDRSALAEIYERYERMCYGAALAATASPALAEDAIQEVFVRLARDPHRLLAADNPCGYLLRMVRNAAIDLLRARRHRPLADDRAAPAIAVDHERSACVANALACLPAEQREVVVLRVWEGRSLEDVAVILGISPNTASSRWRYAVAKLTRLLAHENPHEP